MTDQRIILTTAGSDRDRDEHTALRAAFLNASLHGQVTLVASRDGKPLAAIVPPGRIAPEPAREPGVWTPAQAERVAAARQELIEGLAAELAQHLSNAQDELRRYEAAVAHRESVFQLRIAVPAEQEADHG
jgi:hypothetical protein